MGGSGFGRLWEAFEKPWGALGGCGFSIVCLSSRLWEALGSFGSLWEAVGGSGKLWKALVCFGRLWNALEGFGRHGKALGGFWMFWDALEGWQPGFGPMDALEGFGCFRSL